MTGNTAGPLDDVAVEALAGLLALRRSLGALRAVPEASLAKLETLGLGVTDGAQARRLIDELRRVLVPEPGRVLDEGQDGCDLGWQPSILAPVFYGSREVGEAEGAPLRTAVFFPSTDGSPSTALPVTSCGRYPLVLLLPGSCAETDHFLAWEALAAPLARSGYVVAVPELGFHFAPWDPDNNLMPRLEALLFWMRGGWQYRSLLLSAEMTAVIGHSYGALLAGRLTQGAHPIGAYASLSGVWHEWPSTPPIPLPRIGQPMLLTWGDGLFDANANVAAWFTQLTGVRHSLEFEGGEHWDYLAGRTTCQGVEGDCPGFMRDVAFDTVNAFLSHYLPPERWWLLPHTISEKLEVPDLDLTLEQERYVGGHLTSRFRLAPSGACRASHTWVYPGDPEQWGRRYLRGT